MDRDIFLIEVARPGRDSVPAPADWATTKADVEDLKDAIGAGLTVGSLTDVSGTPGDGDILVYDSGTGLWLVQSPAPSISVADSDSVDLTLTGTQVKADVKFGGNGTASTAARSNHWHWTDTATRVAIVPGGYMSSGTRTLASTSVTLLAGVNYLVEASLNLQMRGADAGAAYYQLRVTINGNARTSPGGTSGKWAVQGVPSDATWDHEQTILGTGAAITVTAQCIYHSGAGFYTDAGDLKITLRPDR